MIAESAGQMAELEVLIVRHRASGWVSEIARKDEDALRGTLRPESGIVTVYEGRPELKALERSARRAGFKPARVRECLPYRMLEVEAAANAVYHWAAELIVAGAWPASCATTRSSTPTRCATRRSRSGTVRTNG